MAWRNLLKFTVVLRKSEQRGKVNGKEIEHSRYVCTKVGPRSVIAYIQSRKLATGDRVMGLISAGLAMFFCGH